MDYTHFEEILNTDQAHVQISSNHVPVIRFDCYEDIPWLAHGFSTRGGGVSTGTFESMNLSFSRGDDPQAAMENFRRFGEAIGISPEQMVFSKQTHTTNVLRVTKDYCGKGILTERDYTDIDGLITNEPQTALVIFGADCVPLFFVDTKNKAIGASHSGWRGTVRRMGAVTVQAMADAFGSMPEDLIAVIGPSVCPKCYEVSKDVADAFMAEFSESQCDQIFIDKGNGKYMLDLWGANRIILEEAGLNPENIHISGQCTHCHPDLLWSHRSLGNARGSLAGFMMIK